jgi:hypothetical protein
MTIEGLCKFVIGYALFIMVLNMMPASWGYDAGVWTRRAVSAVFGWPDP